MPTATRVRTCRICKRSKLDYQMWCEPCHSSYRRSFDDGYGETPDSFKVAEWAAKRVRRMAQARKRKAAK